MPRLKILFFSHSSYLFGAENCLLSLATSLDRERFEPVVVLPADGALKQKLDEAAIRSHIIPMEWWVKNEGRFLHAQNELSQRVDQLLRVVAEERPDVIHSNTSVTWMGAYAARILGIPHVWHLHEMLVGHPSLEPVLPLPLLYQSMDFLSDRVVTVSDELRRELDGYVRPEKVQIIHNGVAPRDVDGASAAAVRSQIDGSEGKILAVTVTSLQKYKGIDHLLDAVAGVVKKRDNVLFVIAGTGPRDAVAALTQRVKELGIDENVRFLGFRDDVPNLLAAADLFVLPSLKEAFPLVVLEAMSQGKPVVTTDCGGTAEMVTDGETGYLVPVGDPAALAEKILALTQDARNRISFGEAGAKRFFDRFTEERYLATFADLYDELAAAPKPALKPKELSTLNALLAGYEGYIRAVRTLPEKESALQSLKHQTVELQALLADRDRKASELDSRSIEQAKELQRKADELEQREALRLQQAQELQQMSAQVRELEAARLEQAAMLQHKSTELLELEAVRLQQTSKLQQELEAVLLQQATELQQKTAELEERDAVIAELRTDLSDLDVRLAQLAEELACAGEFHNELEKRLDWKRAEIVSRDERIHQIRLEINQVGQQRVELEKRLAWKKSEIVSRDERIRQIRLEINHVGEQRVELEKRLAWKKSQILSRDERIRQIRLEIKQVGEQRVELERNLKQKTVELEDRDERLRQVADEIAREAKLMEEQFRQKDQELAQMAAAREAEKQSHDQELTRVREELERLRQSSEQRLREKEQRIDDLLQSLSWKVTAPLRSAYDLVKGRR